MNGRSLREVALLTICALLGSSVGSAVGVFNLFQLGDLQFAVWYLVILFAPVLLLFVPVFVWNIRTPPKVRAVPARGPMRWGQLHANYSD